MESTYLEFLVEYLTSDWSIKFNAFLFLVSAPFAYDAYAKNWSATTGRYSTSGKVTWSEGYMDKEGALVSYSYTVNGKLNIGEMRKQYGQEEFVLAHPVGSQLTIYYSKKNPQFHKVNTPPSKVDLIRASLARIMITMGLVNIPSAYFYWLIGAAA